jgi:hypothetical protein
MDILMQPERPERRRFCGKDSRREEIPNFKEDCNV